MTSQTYLFSQSGQQEEHLQKVCTCFNLSLERLQIEIHQDLMIHPKIRVAINFKEEEEVGTQELGAIRTLVVLNHIQNCVMTNLLSEDFLYLTNLLSCWFLLSEEVNESQKEEQLFLEVKEYYLLEVQVQTRILEEAVEYFQSCLEEQEYFQILEGEEAEEHFLLDYQRQEFLLEGERILHLLVEKIQSQHLDCLRSPNLLFDQDS